MKKLMTIMLGLTLLTGAAVAFAEEKPADDKSKTAKKKRGKKAPAADDKDKAAKKDKR